MNDKQQTTQITPITPKPFTGKEYGLQTITNPTPAPRKESNGSRSPVPATPPKTSNKK